MASSSGKATASSSGASSSGATASASSTSQLQQLLMAADNLNLGLHTDWAQETENKFSYELAYDDFQAMLQQEKEEPTAKVTDEVTEEVTAQPEELAPNHYRMHFFNRHMEYINHYFRQREDDDVKFGTVRNIPVVFIAAGADDTTTAASASSSTTTANSVATVDNGSNSNGNNSSATSTTTTTINGDSGGSTTTTTVASTVVSGVAGASTTTTTSSATSNVSPSSSTSNFNSQAEAAETNVTKMNYRATIQLRHFVDKGITLSANTMYALENPTDKTFCASDGDEYIQITVCGNIPIENEDYVTFYVRNGPMKMPTTTDGYIFHSLPNSYRRDLTNALHEFCMVSSEDGQSYDWRSGGKASKYMRYLLYGPPNYQEKNAWNAVDWDAKDQQCVDLSRPFRLTRPDEWNSMQWQQITAANQQDHNLPATLNDNQLRIINWTMTHAYSIIRGPPGCGKTLLITCICQVLKNRFQPNIAKMKVTHWRGGRGPLKPLMLIVAPSNQACDVLTEMLNRFGIDAPFVTSEARRKHSHNPNYIHMRAYGKLSTEDKATFEDELKGIFLPDRKQYIQRVYTAEAEVLQKCDALICTLPMIPRIRARFGHLIFSAVIVDEASQCTETELLLPLTQSAAKVILVGDEKQLGPTIACDTPLTELTPETRNAMRALQYSGFFNIIERFGIRRFILDLNVHYRMLPSIFELVALRIYETHPDLTPDSYFQDDPQLHYMRIGTSTLNQRFATDPASREVHFFDSDSLNAAEQRCDLTHSISNQIEVDAVIRHYKENRAEYEKQQWSVGIICPYTNQVLLMKRGLRQEFGHAFLEENDIKVATADGYQGSEKDVIFISTTRANDKREIGFLEDRARLTVMLTRAKQQLNIFGSRKTLIHCKSRVLRDYLRYATETTTNVYNSARARIDRSILENVP